MQFDRFDICAAYYHFSMIPVYRHLRYRLNRVLALQWQIDHKLEAIKYKPGLSQEQLSTLNPNAKAIYMTLVRKHLMQETRD
jgi:spore cortex formation protein SpoVR/YcgB (stage V sporulation)